MSEKIEVIMLLPDVLAAGVEVVLGVFVAAEVAGVVVVVVFAVVVLADDAISFPC
ncbi:MAG: hypothetical protein WAL41_10765 [Mycobacterium sp.]